MMAADQVRKRRTYAEGLAEGRAEGERIGERNKGGAFLLGLLAGSGFSYAFAGVLWLLFK